mgnify:CR=1 FL=1
MANTADSSAHGEANPCGHPACIFVRKTAGHVEKCYSMTSCDVLIGTDVILMGLALQWTVGVVGKPKRSRYNSTFF